VAIDRTAPCSRCRAQFACIYPSAGSCITHITHAIGTKAAVAVGVVTILRYIIAFDGIYIFVGSYIAQNVFGYPRIRGLTQIIMTAYGVLVVAPHRGVARLRRRGAGVARRRGRRGPGPRPSCRCPAGWPRHTGLGAGPV